MYSPGSNSCRLMRKITYMNLNFTFLAGFIFLPADGDGWKWQVCRRPGESVDLHLCIKSVQKEANCCILLFIYQRGSQSSSWRRHWVWFRRIWSRTMWRAPRICALPNVLKVKAEIILRHASQLSLKLGILASFYEVKNCSASNLTYGDCLTILARWATMAKFKI